MARLGLAQPHARKLISSVSVNQPKGLLTANLPNSLLGKVATFGAAQRGRTMSR